MRKKEPNEEMFSSQTFCEVCKVGVNTNDWNNHIKSISHKENLEAKEILEKFLRENKMYLPPEFCV